MFLPTTAKNLNYWNLSKRGQHFPVST